MSIAPVNALDLKIPKKAMVILVCDSGESVEKWCRLEAKFFIETGGGLQLNGRGRVKWRIDNISHKGE
jgi:hypothetical protein